MPKTVAIGIQNFETIRQRDCFYIDKTSFIQEWWEQGDDVTLLTRPRRFGKTLNMSMAECFFSNQYKEKGDLFDGLYIWKQKKYREIQGTFPVLSLTFASVKERSYEAIKEQIYSCLIELYDKNRFLLAKDILTPNEKKQFLSISMEMTEPTAAAGLHHLSHYLSRYYGKKVIILLDEYDTPMQEAYTFGYWNELVQFMRSLFNNSFKTNPYIERVLMTGITRVAKESIFSDFNNVRVITTTSDLYETSFGFTETEVFDALDSQGMGNRKEDVKRWYDGFSFGTQQDIYNPWSIINYLSEKKFHTYWANTSSNGLVGKLIQTGDANVKQTMEDLLNGIPLESEIDEQIVFSQLDFDTTAIWSLLLASGYLKVCSCDFQEESGRTIYRMLLTNFEVKVMFENMIRGWFKNRTGAYNDFIKALLADNIGAMSEYMNDIALQCFSYFDTGRGESKKKTSEQFYHGFVLGLLVELKDKYVLTSNRESGWGRYDVMLTPLQPGLNAIILEFKARNSQKENDLEATLDTALKQIKEKNYDADLIARGIPREQIRHYGFAFDGKRVLIG